MNGNNRTLFGYLPDGTAVEELTLTEGPVCCSILTYGGALRSLQVPDRAGRPVDVVLGLDTLEDYMTQDKYLGALVGRYANRIGGSRFTLNGQQFLLNANDGANHLHGGNVGFSHQVWAAQEWGADFLTLSLLSPHGQEGYPGDLHVQVAYALQNGALSISYRAQSSRDTLCNLSSHIYFNLSGHQSGPVAGQYIQLHAGRYTPAAPGGIPTGEIAAVDATPMDLRSPQPIGAHIAAPFPQLVQAGGYDHNWAVDGWDGSLRPAARAWSPDTGISLEVLTTQPGVQFYTGNYLTGCPAGKGGVPYGDRWGFCLETQYFPDSPHHPGFPSPVLAADQPLRSQTVYRLGIAEHP